MNCTKCNALITHENMRKKKNKQGLLVILTRCKHCNNARERKRLGIQDRNCLFCKKILINVNGATKYCSIDHYVSAKYTINDDGCWKWIGSTSHNQPVFTKNRINTSARRHLFKSLIDQNLTDYILLVSCKENLCVNPYHLKKMTTTEYCILVNRNRRKLSKKEVNEIIDKSVNLRWSSVDIAKEYNISDNMINNILKGKSYADIYSSNQEVENYDICSNCSKQHDNLGSQYCSTACMNEYLTKE